MELLSWILLGFLVIFIVKYLHHVYKYNTDSSYRSQSDLDVIHRGFESREARLRGMSPQTNGSTLRKWLNREKGS